MSEASKFLAKFRENSEPSAKFITIGTPAKDDEGFVLSGMQYKVMGKDDVTGKYQILDQAGRQHYLDASSIASVSET